MVNAGGHAEYSPVGIADKLAGRKRIVAATAGPRSARTRMQLVAGYFELPALERAPIRSGELWAGRDPRLYLQAGPRR
jgi:hypothetical protein